MPTSTSPTVRILLNLEPLDAEITRLAGSTNHPVWYAEQLAAFPASHRIAVPRAPGGRARPRPATRG